MRVNDKLVVSEEVIVPISDTVLESAGLLGAIVYSHIEGRAKNTRNHITVSVAVLSEMVSPSGGSHGNENHLLSTLRRLDKLGYIKYSRGTTRKKTTVRLLERHEADFDIDLRWKEASKIFAPTIILILSALDINGKSTTGDLREFLPGLSVQNISKTLTGLSDKSIVTKEEKSIKGKVITYEWDINWDKIITIGGFDMTSNLSKLLELKEIYFKRAEEAQDAVKFYEEKIAEELKLERVEN